MCGNYTWRSAMFSSDVVVISKDLPCSAVLETTYVSPTCEATRSKANGIFFIGVYGYQDSRFSLLVTPSGAHIALMAGKPLHTATTLGYICPVRDHQTGSCLQTPKGSPQNILHSVAYFRLEMSPTGAFINTADHEATGTVVFTIQPVCNSSSSGGSSRGKSNEGSNTGESCQVGCSCSPLFISLRSCAASKCGIDESFPSPLPGHHDAFLEVEESGSSLFVMYDMTNPHNGYCDPDVSGEACIYFLAVQGAVPAASQPPPSFSIESHTPGAVSLISCDASHSPDGIRRSSKNVVHQRDSRIAYYEICTGSHSVRGSVVTQDRPEGRTVATDSTKGPGSAIRGLAKSDDGMSSKSTGDLLFVTAEVCSGNIKLLACTESDQCTSFLPSLESYAYLVSESTSCRKRGGASGHEVCTPLSLGSIPRLELLADSGNIFLGVQGEGEYILNIQEEENGRSRAPALMRYQNDGSQSSISLAAAASDSHVLLEWPRSLIYLPGVDTLLNYEELEYTLYIVRGEKVSSSPKSCSSEFLREYRLDTLCGLEHLAMVEHSRIEIVRLPATHLIQKGEIFQYRLSGLDANTCYVTALIAECDGTCLRQVAQTSAEYRSLDGAGCGGSIACTRQTYVYSSTEWSTDFSPPIELESTDQSISEGSRIALAVSILILVIGSCLGALYCHRASKVIRNEYNLTEMVESELSFSPMTRHAPARKILGENTDYQPPSVGNAIGNPLHVQNPSLRPAYTNRSTVHGAAAYQQLSLIADGSDDDRDIEVAL
jgi:hypothetical protein